MISLSIAGEAEFVKRVALLGFSGVLLLIAVVVVLPTFLDWNKYSDSITSVLEETTGRAISVGNLKFFLLPQPTLRAADVVVANMEGGRNPEFARLQALDIRISFLALLTGKVRITSIGLVHPEVHLEMLADGRNNWTFGDEGQGNGGSGVRIDRLAVSDGTIDYAAADGTRYQLTDIDGHLTARSLTGPIEGEATLRFDDVPLGLEVQAGDFADGSRPAPLSLVLTVAQADASLKLSGRMVMDDRSFSGMVNLAGPDLGALARELSRIQAVPDLPAMPAVPFTLSASATGDAEAVALSDLRLSADSEDIGGSAAARLGDAPSAELHLTTSRFNLDRLLGKLPASPPVRAGGEAPFSLPEGIRLSADLSANALDYKGGILRQVRVAGHLEDGSLMISRAAALLPGAADVSLSGRLGAAGGKPVFAGQVSANAGNARALLEWAGLDVSTVPEGQLGQFTLSTPMALQGDRLQLAGLELGLDRSRLTGNVSLTLGDQPDITADVALDRLDADAYMPPPSQEKREPLTLEALTGFSGDVRARIARLSYDGRVATDVTAHALLDGKTLTIRQFDVDQIGGGRLALTGSVTSLAKAPAADLSLTAQGESASRFLSALGYDDAGGNGALGGFALTAAYKGTLGEGEAALDGTVGATTLSLKASLRDMTAGQPAATASFEVRNPNLSDLARQFGNPLPAPEQGAMPVSVSGKLDGSSAQGTVNATATVGSGALTVSGNYAKAATGMTYRVDVTGNQDDPVPLLRAFGLPYQPAGPLDGATLAATVNVQPDVTRLENLKLQMGAARLEGLATWDATGQRPKLTAQVQGSDVILDAFLPPATTGVAQMKAAKGQSAAAKAHARWSHEPMDWSVIRDTDMDMRITAASLRYGPYVFTGPSLMVTARDGVLKVDPLTAGLFGGSATIRLTADATGTPRMTIDSQLKDVDVAQLTTAAMGNRFATGKLELAGQFTASGASQLDMIRSLGGSAQLAARDGVIEKVDLPALSKRINALRSVNDFLATARAALSGGQTPYKSVAGEVVVEKGVARTRNVTSDIAAAKADLTATADLPDWTLDGLASFALTEVPGAPPVTVTLKGPIDEPTRTLGTQRLQTYVVGRLGAAVLREAIGNQEGGLGQLLGTPTQQDAAPPPADGQQTGENPLKPFQMLFDQLRKKKEN